MLVKYLFNESASLRIEEVCLNFAEHRNLHFKIFLWKKTMKEYFKFLHSLIIVFSLFLPAVSQASLVTFEFSGTVNQVYAAAASSSSLSGILAGHSVNGWYTFESTTPGTPGIYYHIHKDMSYWNALHGFDISISGSSFYLITENIGSILIQNNSETGGALHKKDFYQVNTGGNLIHTESDDRIMAKIILTDGNANAGSGTNPDGLTSSALPLTPPNLSLFDVTTRIDILYQGNLAMRVDLSALTLAADGDGDGIADIIDNCPSTYNTNQSDIDQDGKGDDCDNCPGSSNPDQADSDKDSIGNDCDNCPNTPSLDLTDTDNDGLGDACDPDIDGDGINNKVDQCPSTSYQMAIYSDGCKAQDLYDQIDQLSSDVAAKDAIIAQKNSEIMDLNIIIASMFTQDQLDLAVAEAEAAKDLIISSRDLAINDLNEEISILNEIMSTMYTEGEYDEAVNKAKADGDFFVIPVRVPCPE